ncbi:MFS transporter [candidate division KSB1 bacterium]
MDSKKSKVDINLPIIFSITLMAVAGVASITPAFPLIIEKLNISAKSIGLLITVFTFPGVILTPVLGIMADRYGRKKILVPSLFLFAAAGFACFFARDFNLLLGFRFIQGIGAAALGALNATIIGDVYTGNRRAQVMGYNASVLQIGVAAYPTIGGALTILGWYYPFLVPLLALPVGLFVLFYLNNPEPRNDQKLSEYLKDAWISIKRIQVITIFITGVAAFIVIFGAYLTYFPILLVRNHGVTPFEIGLIMSCFAFSTAITSFQLGKISKKYPIEKLLKISFIIGFFCMPLIPLAGKIWMIIVLVIFMGCAQGISIPAMMTILAGLAPMETRAVFMSLNGSIIRMGQTIGPLLMGFVLGLFGLNAVFTAGAIILFLIALLLIYVFR